LFLLSPKQSRRNGHRNPMNQSLTQLSRSAAYRRIKQPSSQRMELARRRKVATTTSISPNRRHSASRRFLGAKNYEVDGYFVADICALVDRTNDHGTNDFSGQSTHGHYHHLTQPSAQRVEPREVIRKNIVELKALRAVGTESRALAGRVSFAKKKERRIHRSSKPMLATRSLNIALISRSREEGSLFACTPWVQVIHPKLPQAFPTLMLRNVEVCGKRSPTGTIMASLKR
jgi:hypothetical protein